MEGLVKNLELLVLGSVVFLYWLAGAAPPSPPALKITFTGAVRYRLRTVIDPTEARFAYRARSTNLSRVSHESATHDHNSCRNAERQCDLNHTFTPVSRTAFRVLNM